MVQEFHVVRCFSCQSYQVQQVKKVNKWSCKLCGEKQTLLKEFGRGSGADCRRHVQKLNALRGAVMEEKEHHTWSLWEQAEEEEQKAPEEEDQVSQPQVSRWSKYLDTPEEAEDENEEEQNVLMDRKHFHGNHMTDRKRKRGGERDHCSPEQHKPGLMMPPKTTRTTIFQQTSMSKTRTTIPNSTSLPQSRTTIPNPTSLPQSRTTIPNPTSLEKTRQNWSRSSGSGVCKSSRWACFLSSDSQVKVGEGSSDSGYMVIRNDVTTQPSGLVRPRPLLPASSMFECGDEFSFDDFLSDDL